MRGFPLLNLILVLAACAGAIFPWVQRTAHVAVAQPPVAAASTATTVGATVLLRFVHPPTSARLLNGNEIIHAWATSDLERELSTRLDLPVEEQRAELTLEVVWPQEIATTMVEVKVEADGVATWTTNAWSDGARVEEVLSIPLPPAS
jgi:hypothetical protein